MFLRSLEINNYRPLEHVELNKLEKFNVLIGRNNSGKSSVFGALSLINSGINGARIPHETSLTARDKTRTLEFRLLFEPRPSERIRFVNLVGAGLTSERRTQMLESPLLRQIEYTLQSEHEENVLQLLDVKVMAENGKWGTVLSITKKQPPTTPTFKVVYINKVASNLRGILHHNLLSIDASGEVSNTSMSYNFAGANLSGIDPALAWLLMLLPSYLGHAFFFNPFRHSTAQLGVQQVSQLAQDGSNLAQVLHTINSNDRKKFSEIEEFIHAALPDIGDLQTPLISTNTEVAFLQRNGSYSVRLHEMGGGIEQLLMVATVLLTTSDESTLFLEEPESHLHAGAQRFLIERLYQGDRQVFITTHSPTFVNSPRRRSLYQVKLANSQTTITRVGNAELLGQTLEDIGSRNSDVLLSDAVLFVEGPSDQRAFEVFSESLGMSLDEHNITVLPMGGGDYGSRTANVRSEVLEGISRKAAVPHFFIIDRDERSEKEITKLRKSLGDKIHVLSRRELENYLLIPRALIEALKSKHKDDAPILERVSSTTAEQVETHISETAESLYGLILLKRIRSAISGLKGGILPQESLIILSRKHENENLAELIRQELEIRVNKHVASLKLERIVETERNKLVVPEKG